MKEIAPEWDFACSLPRPSLARYLQLRKRLAPAQVGRRSRATRPSSPHHENGKNYVLEPQGSRLCF